MNKKKSYISYKFVTPSFFQGIGSVLSITGNYYNVVRYLSDPNEDSNAIASDWSVVGYDILNAKEELEKCA